MAEPKVGLVTVTYNSGKVLNGFFKSLWAQQHGNFICVVVDNQSRDGTIDQLGQQTDARLQVIANDQNLGVAEGNNQGIRHCQQQGCDYILLINNDTEFGPELISRLVGASVETGNGLVIPKMYFYEPGNMIWCAGGHFIRWAAWSNRHVGEGEVDVGQYDEAKLVEYAPTCCMLVKSEIFATVGLMDPEYFVYYDDVDFCIKVNKAGYGIFYFPAAKLWHKVSSLTGGSQSDFSVGYTARNRAMLINKNFSGLEKLFFHGFNLVNFGRRFVQRQDDAAIFSRKLKIYVSAMRGKY